MAPMAEVPRAHRHHRRSPLRLPAIHHREGANGDGAGPVPSAAAGGAVRVPPVVALGRPAGRRLARGPRTRRGPSAGGFWGRRGWDSGGAPADSRPGTARFAGTRTKIYRTPLASRLTKVAAQPGDRLFPRWLLSMLPTESQSNQPTILWRLRSMDLFGSNQCTHLQIFATRSTCLQKCARCFMCMA